MVLHVGVQDGVLVGLQVLGLLLEPSEVSEAGRLISDCWPGSGGMHQIQRACQMAAQMEED